MSDLYSKWKQLEDHNSLEFQFTYKNINIE